MAAIQKGKATLQGIQNDGTAIDIDYDAFIDTAKLNHDWETEAVKDNENATAGETLTDSKYETDIVLVPNGTTIANAHTATVLLDPGDSVTFAHFKVSAFNGDWSYRGGSIDLSKQTGKVSLKFRKWTDSDQNTLMNTTAS